MKIEAVIQQDVEFVELGEGFVTITQKSAADGSEDSIWIAGRTNLDAVIAALQKAREGMQA
jgi:hypothetical protein